VTPAVIGAFLAAFCRVAAFFHAAPLTGRGIMPANIRVGAAAAIAMALAPLRPEVEPALLLVVLPAEIALGLLAGFASRLVLAGAESAGQIIGMNIGLGFAASVDPIANEQTLAVGRIIWLLGALAFLGAGGFEAAIPVLALAPAKPLVLAGSVAALIDASSTMLVAAIRFSAPVLLAGLIVNVAMAMASRAAPAMNVFSVMLSALMVLGGIVLFATAPGLIRDLGILGQHMAEAPARILGY